MNQELRDLAIRLLDQHRIMTIATNRPDGWPQATVVGYANEGLTIYCFVSRLSQKYANIARDKRVSIAIADDVRDPLQIKGLSLAARAMLIEDREEFDRACETFMKRYPEYASWPRPDPSIAPMLRFTPRSSPFSIIPRALDTAILSACRQAISPRRNPGAIGSRPPKRFPT